MPITHLSLWIDIYKIMTGSGGQVTTPAHSNAALLTRQKQLVLR